MTFSTLSNRDAADSPDWDIIRVRLSVIRAHQRKTNSRKGMRIALPSRSEQAGDEEAGVLA